MQVQEYKDKMYKRKLTISDINMVSKFAQNSQSLKQIDEELEYNSSHSEEEKEEEDKVATPT